MIDGKEVNSLEKKGMELGEWKEYIVPEECVSDMEIAIKWSISMEDLQKNWRQRARICEMWLLKQ